MFDVLGRTIRVSRGDTGVIRFLAEGIELTDNDLCVFTIRRKSGGTAMEKVVAPEENAYYIPFTNEETERFPVDDYEWDIRVVLDVVKDDAGRVTGGREVLTPWAPGVFKVVKVVGNV